VTPLLEGDPAWLVVSSLVPGSDPVPELAWVLAVTGIRLGLGWSASDVHDRLDAGPDGLRRVVNDLLVASAGAPQRRLVAMVDQAEELFTRTAPDARDRFALLLREAVAGLVRVVVAMRSEFLDDLRDLPPLAGVPIEASVLAPLDREMLREVIERPAKVARLRLDDGLATQLVADTGSGEALPLLAFTLRQLAEGLPARGTVTLAHYHNLGRVQGALTRHADAAFTDAVQVSGLTEREVLGGLTRLVTVDETGRRARRRSSPPACLSRCAWHWGSLWSVACCSATPTRPAKCGSPWRMRPCSLNGVPWRPPPLSSPPLRIARTVEHAATEWTSADRAEHYLWDDKRLTTTLTTRGLLRRTIRPDSQKRTHRPDPDLR
jgi:hypothetical protein